MVIGEWSSCPYLNPWTFLIKFSPFSFWGKGVKEQCGETELPIGVKPQHFSVVMLSYMMLSFWKSRNRDCSLQSLASWTSTTWRWHSSLLSIPSFSLLALFYCHILLRTEIIPLTKSSWCSIIIIIHQTFFLYCRSNQYMPIVGSGMLSIPCTHL